MPLPLDAGGIGPVRVVDPLISRACRLGGGYSAATGKIASGGANLQAGASLFNAASSGVTVVVYSIRCTAGNTNSQLQVTKTTADPALPAAMTVSNDLIGGAPVPTGINATTMAGGFTAGVAVAGTVFASPYQQASQDLELLVPGKEIVLPLGVAAGVAVWPYLTTSGNIFSVTFSFIVI